MNEIKNERGAIGVIILVFFIIISIFLYALYKIVIMDYMVTSSSIEESDRRLIQSNILESLKVNYEEDMLNDIEYIDMESKSKENWNIEYINYMYGYVKDYNDGESSDTLGKFGRFNWVDFTHYETVLPALPEQANENAVVNVLENVKPIRVYNVSENWKGKLNGIDIENSEVYSNGKLNLPKAVYMKITFDPGVSRINMTLGNTFQTVEKEFINRSITSGGETIVKLTDLPPSIEEITLTSEESLGSTKFSFLYSRDIDIEVFNKDNLGNKEGDKVLVKTLRIELGKKNNIPNFLKIGSEVE